MGTALALKDETKEVSGEVLYGEISIEDFINTKFFQNYKNTVKERIGRVVDLSTFSEDKFHKMCFKRLQNHKIQLYNNVKDTYYETDALELLNLIKYSKTKPIVTAFNTIFHNQNKKENVPGKFVKFLLGRRKVIKNEMFKHINDEDKSLYIKLDIGQGVVKVFANSYYGASGEKSFQFFNPVIGPSTTAQGQQIVISAILGFEGFLGDNIDFYTFDDLILFLENIRKEKYDEEFYLEDTPEITPTILFERYKSKCKFEFSETQEAYLEAYFEDDLPLTVLQKFYYKNRIFELFKVPYISEVILENFIREDFPDVNEPPEEIKELLDEFYEILNYFVAYPYPIPNKTELVNNLIRKVVIISDTDSTFLNIDPYFEFVIDLAGISKSNISKLKQISIVTVMTYFITKFVNSVFGYYCRNINTLEEYIPMINMKSEFHYKRVVMTRNKKNYAGVILSKEGKVFNTPEFDIKGIQIKKISTPKLARKFFGEVLENDILNSKQIDANISFLRFLKFENRIRSNIEECKTEFLKPSIIKSISSYTFPYRMEAYRGVLVWNKLFPSDSIQEFTALNIIPFKNLPGNCEENHIEYLSNLKGLLNDSQIDKLIELFNEHEELRHYGLREIAIPKNYNNFPEGILPIVDIDFIISTTLSKGIILLESIGFIGIKSKKFQGASNLIDI